MTLFYALFFGAGIAAVAYSTIGRRVGYTNSQNIVVLLSVIFLIGTAVAYSILAIFIH